jgi:hypothetical protein
VISPRALIGPAVSVVFITVAFWQVDLASFLDAIATTDYLLIGPAIVAYFAAFWLRAIRWKVLLLPLGPVTTGRTYWVATIGYAINNALPLRVGEFARAFLMKRRPGFGAPATLATIAVERILDGMTLLVWLGVALLVSSSSWEASSTMRFLLQAAAGLFGLATIAIVPIVAAPDWSLGKVRTIFGVAPERVRKPVFELAENAVRGFSSLREGRLALMIVALSQGVWIGETMVYWLVARAMDFDVSWPVLAATVAASNLATSVPSSSGAIGPFELLAKETLVLAGFAASAAAAYAVLVHLTLLAPVTILGAVFLVAEGASLREAVRGPRPVEVIDQ